jgi:hypothetical protein
MRGRRRQVHPTCAHAKDLQALFREIDVNCQGYLDVHSLRARIPHFHSPNFVLGAKVWFLPVNWNLGMPGNADGYAELFIFPLRRIIWTLSGVHHFVEIFICEK